MNSRVLTGFLLGGMLVFFAGARCIGAFPEQEALKLRSPDGTIELSVTTQGGPAYAIRVDGKLIVQPSRLGLAMQEGYQLGPGARVLNATRRSANSTWENHFGKRLVVCEHFNELRLGLVASNERKFEIVFRCYDDGVAFRYVLPAQSGLDSFTVARELTQFSFAGDYPCFAGQQEKGFQGAQEWEFKPGHVSELKPESIVGLPLLVQTPAAWVAVLESDLRNWAGMWLCGEPGSSGVTLAAKLAPRKDGQGLVKGAAPQSSPWRVLMIGRQPGRLLESDLVMNLAEPSQLGDTSWVRPGKMAWDHWWSGDVRMDTSTIKDYIQLAAEMGWPYQLIDWQWYGPFNKPDSDITQVNPAVDMDEVRDFAKTKGVRLWVWLYWSDVDRNDAYKKAFALYEKWGLAGVKIDFMDRDDQEMVDWYEKITRAAAAHHLMVNFHGAFKTSGFNRTFPNQITREGVLGNEYNRWSARVTPEHKLTLPFTRFLAGPADFTPGGFLNRQPDQFKPDAKAAEVQGTRAAELALFVLYDSPLCCVCDLPAHYDNQPGAGFLKIVPTVWDETKVLDGEVGQHLAMARRSGQDWFIGGATVAARDFSLNLEFLKRGKWRVHLWQDAPDSDKNAEHLETQERLLTKSDTLQIHAARSGGFVAWLQKQ